jgi:hypothetical protein
VAALVPSKFTSAAGATGAIAQDGIVLVTGNLAKDTYTLEAKVPEGGKPVAVRLELLADDSLPQKGPGRAGNGNLVLSTFKVMTGPPGGTEAPTAVVFTEAKADFEQESFGVAGTLDDKPETGWALAGGVGKDHMARFVVKPDQSLPAGAPLVIVLDQQHADGMHAIGKFRVSLEQEAAPPAAPPPAAKPEEKKPDEKKPEEKK